MLSFELDEGSLGSFSLVLVRFGVLAQRGQRLCESLLLILGFKQRALSFGVGTAKLLDGDLEIPVGLLGPF